MELPTTVTHQNDRTMMRVYGGEQKGTTAFFRNRPLLETVLDGLESVGAERLRVLFHAVSIGAEAYSFAAWCLKRGVPERVGLEIAATDLNPQFLAYGRRAVYPAAVLQTMTDQERQYFEPAGHDRIRPVAAVREMVRFLPPMSFVTGRPDGIFDAVFVMNAITYVLEAEQAAALDRIATYNSRYLILTAFHPDTIEADLRRNHYRPIVDNIGDIHNAWAARVQPHQAIARGSAEYSWVLPPFSERPGYRYRFCSMFEKAAAAE